MKKQSAKLSPEHPGVPLDGHSTNFRGGNAQECSTVTAQCNSALLSWEMDPEDTSNDNEDKEQNLSTNDADENVEGQEVGDGDKPQEGQPSDPIHVGSSSDISANFFAGFFMTHSINKCGEMQTRIVCSWQTRVLQKV